jgi:hypothetical protein
VCCDYFNFFAKPKVAMLRNESTSNTYRCFVAPHQDSSKAHAQNRRRSSLTVKLASTTKWSAEGCLQSPWKLACIAGNTAFHNFLESFQSEFGVIRNYQTGVFQKRRRFLSANLNCTGESYQPVAEDH